MYVPKGSFDDSTTVRVMSASSDKQQLSCVLLVSLLLVPLYVHIYIYIYTYIHNIYVVRVYSSLFLAQHWLVGAPGRRGASEALPGHRITRQISHK